MLTRVNRIELDGTVVTTTIGIKEIPAVKVSYGDSLKTEVVRKMGSQTQNARTAGTYETDQVELVFSASDFRALLMPLFPTQGAGNVLFEITVGYTHPDIGSDSDLLKSARCVNIAAAAEAAAKGLEASTKWDILQVLWTDRRVAINAVDIFSTLSPSAFNVLLTA